jgi:hypothetical protein
MGIEDVPAVELDPVDDQSRIDRLGGVGGALSRELERAQKHRDRQKAPKRQQNSNK